MRGALAAALVLVLLGPTSLAVGAPVQSPPETPRLVAVYPNPALPDDRGEFVEVSVPAGAPATISLTDGETEVSLPADVPAGVVAVATEPAARNLTDVPVVVVAGTLRLANGGERVELRVDGALADAVTYPRAPEGSVYRRTGDGWAWRRLGATDFGVVSAEDVAARVFVLPDAPSAAFEALEAADRRLWLAAYTMTSRRVVERLCVARGHGVDVRVLAERAPVGGLSAAGADRLDRLDDCGVDVRVVGGPGGRYAFHHAKYAVVDDRAVVLTENWKPSGVGGRSSRGWGAVVDDPAIADALATTFEADAGWRDARPWPEVREDRRYTRTEPPANGSYPALVTPARVDDVDVEVLLAPDNAEGRVVELIDGATESIRVIQVSVGGTGQPFVRALVRAARRGVEVRLLLASVWYAAEPNRATADELNALARSEGLSLRVRLANPRGRFGKVHAKGVVVDGEHVLLGSLNWNNASARLNREVVLALHGERVGAYYVASFDADWQGGTWRVPVGLPAVAASLALVAAAFARRSIAFEDPEDEGVGPTAVDLEFQGPY